MPEKLADYDQQKKTARKPINQSIN